MSAPHGSEETRSDPDGAPSPSSNRDLVIVLTAVLGSLLLFVTKAYTIDDTLFLALARHLQRHPLDFYGFDVNWYGVVMPMSHVTKNPPLAGYYLSVVSAVGGWSEAWVHGAFLVPAGFVAAGTLRLARRFCARPVAATLMGLLTPVFVVSSSNVMSDTTMLAFWVWAIALWVSAIDRSRSSFKIASAVLIVLAGLTKYFGFALIPLLLVYAVVRERKFAPATAALLIPVATAVAYQLGTDAAYGRGLLLDAASYSGQLRELEQSAGGNPISQTLTGLIFLGGCVASSILFLPWLWSRKALAVVLVLVGAGSVGSILAGWLPGLNLATLRLSAPWTLYPQGWLMLAGGASLVAIAGLDWFRRRDADSALLVLWLLGTFVFASNVNWVNNGRSNLPMAPVAGILILRRMHDLGRLPAKGLGQGAIVAGVLSAVVALLVGYADARWANDVRGVARSVLRHASVAPATHFQGHWGFQYYMEEGGARAFDLSRDTIRPGELLVVPYNNTDVYPPPLRGGYVEMKERIEVPRTWVHTVGADTGAGFYASNMGSLPFVFGTVPVDVTDVYLAQQPFSGQLDKEKLPWW